MSRWLAVALLVAGGSAQAAPRGGYIRVPAREAKPAAAASSKIIYLNRSPAAGVLVHFNPVDDSRLQNSSIAMGDAVIGPFTQSPAVWSALVDCVKTTYSPFDVTVTDVDPGNVPHFENIVGGVPSDLRNDISGAGGVAPLNCVEIPNAISYTFDVYGPNSAELCWTVAQETAHSFGLEHEFLDPDPMTYLTGVLPKRFQDTNAQCGEFTTRACACPSRPMQNSYRMIVGLFGPGAPITPTVAISDPPDGKNVQPGFTVTATADSIVRIDHVELWIDGVMAGSVMTPPYMFQPDGLDLGPHTLEARAYDVQSTPGSAMSTITLEPPCTRTKGCDGTDVCVDGVCTAGPMVPGGLGAGCNEDKQCLSMQCANTGGPNGYCVAACELGNAATCPSGFDCVNASSGSGVCFPSDGGGCCDAGGEPRGALVLAAGVLLIVLRRRQ
jgi:hypothetical protein